MEIPEGIELRPITREDLPEVHGVMRRSEVKDNEPMVTQFDEVVSEYEAPFFDPESDSALPSIVRASGRMGQGLVPAEHRARAPPLSLRRRRPRMAPAASGPPCSTGSCSAPGNW